MAEESKKKMGISAKRRMKNVIRDGKGRIVGFGAMQEPPIEWTDLPELEQFADEAARHA